MFDKLEGIERKFLEIEEEMGRPEILADIPKLNELSRKRSDMEEIVEKFRSYKKLKKNITDHEIFIVNEQDTELITLANEELDTYHVGIQSLEQELKLLLVPKDADDKRNVYLEIRGGTGGEEAALFARDLYTMYTRYVDKQGWTRELIDFNESDAGGLAKVVILIQGKGVYGNLKFESGIHRVQRVPVTEASGRIHTSAATVAVLPEVEDVDIQINANDLKIDTYRASGAGGQHINRTDSAIRITHLPTGVVVTCQDGRSQHQNKERAMQVLKSRIYEQAVTEQQQNQSQARKSLVGSGDRSEKIRTYNFPQNRITDHRIGLTIHKLDTILSGDLSGFIEALQQADRLEKLQNADL